MGNPTDTTSFECPVAQPICLAWEVISALPLGLALLCSYRLPTFPAGTKVLPVSGYSPQYSLPVCLWFSRTQDSGSDLVPAPQCLPRNGILGHTLASLFWTPCASSGVCYCPQPWVAKPRVLAPNQSPSCFASCLTFISLHSFFGVFSVPWWYPSFLLPLPILYSFSVLNISTQSSLLCPWAHSRPYLYIQTFVLVTKSHCSKGS